MIIPEVINSNLNKRKLLDSFLKLSNSRKNQDSQIDLINFYLKEIVKDFSPYEVSVERINKLLA